MSYQGYVVAAYAVFVVVLLWDAIAPRIAIRQSMRAAKMRHMRGVTHPAPDQNGLSNQDRPPGESRGPL